MHKINQVSTRMHTLVWKQLTHTVIKFYTSMPEQFTQEMIVYHTSMIYVSIRVVFTM